MAFVRSFAHTNSGHGGGTHWVMTGYNNQNIEGISYDYRYSTRQYVSGVPILPSLGIRGEL